MAKVATFPGTSIQPVRHIMVGVEPTDTTQLGLQLAVAQALTEHATLTLAMVMEPYDVSVYVRMNTQLLDRARTGMRHRLHTYARLARKAGVTTVTTFFAEGMPGDVLVNEAIPQVKPDLLIVGAETKVGAHRHFGSQVAYVVRYAPCTVTVAR